MRNESNREIIPNKWIIFFLRLWSILQMWHNSTVHPAILRENVIICSKITSQLCDRNELVPHRDESSLKLCDILFSFTADVLSLLSSHDELALIVMYPSAYAYIASGSFLFSCHLNALVSRQQINWGFYNLRARTQSFFRNSWLLPWCILSDKGFQLMPLCASLNAERKEQRG